MVMFPDTSRWFPVLLLAACLLTLGSSQTTTAGPDEIWCGDNCIDTKYAIATFATYGLEGTVKVIEGHINISISLADFDWDDFEYGRSCFNGGIYYGIYDAWEYDDTTALMGDENCAVDYTGKRWDPWKACSSLSSNEYCDLIDNDDGCVLPGLRDTTVDIIEDENIYTCSEQTYSNDPFSCEVGDWSGKYGVLYYNSETEMIEGGGASPYEMEGYDLSGKSIVFRCHDQTRFLCSAFEEYSLTSSEEEQYPYRPAQNGTYTKIAKFGDNNSSYVKLTYYHEYEIVISSSEIDIPGTCGDELYYRIFTDYSDILGCDSGSGSFYDPTISCDENSDMTNTDYCDDTQICGDGDYFYSCNYSTNLYRRFNCAPGDLADKYGSVDLSGSTTFAFAYNGTDSLMLPIASLEGKSLVLQCSSDYSIIACGKFEDYKDDAGRFGTYVDDDDSDGSDDSDDSGGGSGSSSSGNILGFSQTAVIIFLSLLGLSIIPCVKHMRDKKQKETDRLGGTTSSTGAAGLGGGERERDKKRKRRENGGGSIGSGTGSVHSRRGAGSSDVASSVGGSTVQGGNGGKHRRGMNSVDSRTGSNYGGSVAPNTAQIVHFDSAQNTYNEYNPNSYQYNNGNNGNNGNGNGNAYNNHGYNNSQHGYGYNAVAAPAQQQQEQYGYNGQYDDYGQYNEQYDGQYHGQYNEQYSGQYSGQYDEHGQYNEEYDPNGGQYQDYDENNSQYLG